MPTRDAFLAGDHPDDVAIYLADTILSGDHSALAERGVRTEEGVFLILPGEQGRALVAELLDIDAMTFARQAMDTDGDIAPDLSSGTCPTDEPDDHAVSFLFSFVEPEHDDMEGRYGEGPVLHAYAACQCGQTYSDRWSIPGEDA